jgi:type 1 glutamine amidotransferase
MPTMKSILTLCSAAALALLPALPAAAAPKKLLVFTQSKGFVHNPVKRGTSELCLVERTLAEIAAESKAFTTVNSQKAEEALTRENLAQFDGVLFYTTGDLLSPDKDRQALIDFVSQGKAMVVIHSGMDTYPGFKPYIQMVNGNFDGHPWGAGTTCTFTNHEPTHPTVAMYPSEFQFKDEIYQYKFAEPSAVRVLMSLNMAKNKPQMPWHVPVVWVREYGSGRVFVSNLGHNDATWKDAKFREHLLAGIRWAMKETTGPAQPNVDTQAIEAAKSFFVVTGAQSKKDWSELVAKVAAKAKSDPALVTLLHESIAAYRKLPNPDTKKAKPEEVEAAAAKRTELLNKVLAAVEK